MYDFFTFAQKQKYTKLPKKLNKRKTKHLKDGSLTGKAEEEKESKDPANEHQSEDQGGKV